MALPVAFSLLHSELNDFLFAPLGEEADGQVPLSVLSALTRLDIDPWAEAARLTAMPRDAVVDALVSLIGRFPREHQTPAEAREIAGRLAALLPTRPVRTSPAAPRTARPRAIWLVAGGAIIVVAALAMRGWLPWP